MANIKSAIKRVEIAERNRLRNKSYKSAVKTLMKKYLAAVNTHAANPSTESMQEVQRNLSSAFSKIDKAVKTGALHPNNGARKKSRLTQALKRYTSEPSGVSSPAAPAQLTPVQPVETDVAETDALETDGIETDEIEAPEA